MNLAKVAFKIAEKAKNLSNKVSLNDVMKIADIFGKTLSNPKNILPRTTIFGTQITLTNN